MNHQVVFMGLINIYKLTNITGKAPPCRIPSEQSHCLWQSSPIRNSSMISFSSWVQCDQKTQRQSGGWHAGQPSRCGRSLLLVRWIMVASIVAYYHLVVSEYRPSPIPATTAYFPDWNRNFKVYTLFLFRCILKLKQSLRWRPMMKPRIAMVIQSWSQP